jgi:hypothetical protein
MLNDELHNLYSSSNIIKMIKSGTMRLAGHVARMVAKRNAYRILGGNSEDLGIAGKIILKCILENLDGVVWTGFISLRIGIIDELFCKR